MWGAEYFLDWCGARGDQAQAQGMAEWAVLLAAGTANLLDQENYANRCDAALGVIATSITELTSVARVTAVIAAINLVGRPLLFCVCDSTVACGVFA